LRKRKRNWAKSDPLNRSRLSGYLLLSLGLHITFFIAHMLTPAQEKVTKGPPPIQVKYIETKKPMHSNPRETLDISKPPEKKERSKRKELLAKFDRRSHSNKKMAREKVYKQKKTVIPNSRSIVGKTRSSKTQTKNLKPRKNFQKNSKLLKPKNKPFPESEIGKFKSLTPKKIQKPTPSTIQKSGAGGTLAMLDGFNAEQFASLDTGPLEDFDDDEPVSLDTTEVKYSSYFARIKHQIERVWIYPIEAAQRGISGDLSLTFRISKDGNLLGVRLVDQSGYEILDVAAFKAVKEAAPFYPFPKNIQREKLTILANFVYTPILEP